MKTRIIEKLRLIENDHQIKILFAVEVGSRRMNLSSPNSDYDVRFVYCHKLEWYLSLNQKQDVYEEVNDLFDMEGWELKKALLLFSKANPSILEWIHSPIVFLNDYSLLDQLIKFEDYYYSTKQKMIHSINMAHKNYKTYLQKDEVNIKHLFNVLRPLFLCMWTEKYHTYPPNDFESLVLDLIDNTFIQNEILNLIYKKRTGILYSYSNPIINQFIEEKINYYFDYIKSLKLKKVVNIEPLNQLFRQTLDDAWK